MTNISPKLLEYQRRARKIPVWAGKGYAPSKHAEFKSDDLVFQRQQSPRMAQLEWERPVEPVWKSILAGIFLAITMAIIIILTLAA